MNNPKKADRLSPPIVKVISFGSGIPGIEFALSRLRKQASSLDLIDEVETFTEQDLDEEYHKLFYRISHPSSPGFGYWSWKPYLISRQLEILNEGDILIYLDAGVEINSRARNRFTEYLDLVSQQDALLFSQPFQQRQWTKASEELVPIDRHYFRNQVVAGILLFRVSERSRTLVKKWLDLCSQGGGDLLSDSITIPDNGASFTVAHRHDQSVLSRVVYDEAVPVIKDETYYEKWSKGKEAPFLAFRNRQTGISWIWAATYLPKPLFLLWQFLTLAITPRVLLSKITKKC